MRVEVKDGLEIHLFGLVGPSLKPFHSDAGGAFMELCHYCLMCAPTAVLDLHTVAQLDKPKLAGHAVRGPWMQMGQAVSDLTPEGSVLQNPAPCHSGCCGAGVSFEVEQRWASNPLLWVEETCKAAITWKGLLEHPGWRAAIVTRRVQLDQSHCVKQCQWHKNL